MSALDTFLSTVPLPDFIYRFAIKKQLSQRLAQEKAEYKRQTIQGYAEKLKKQPIVIQADKANEQHYEVPAAFYEKVLGKRKKYSACYYPEEGHSLDEAEEEMFKLTCENAELRDGQSILELGCGWGSLSIYMAENYPNSDIVAVSNSSSQREYIESKAHKLGIKNLSVITENVQDLEIDKTFNRVVTLEMLEHIRNYEKMFAKISGWLKKDGKCFVHVFGHKSMAYEFDSQDSSSWMAKHFFSGGQMPSRDLFAQFSNDLKIQNQWTINGRHYAKTCRDWLKNMDANKSEVKELFKEVYKSEAKKFWIYWRLFFMACEELFAFNNGEEWQVYHYLFVRK